jgi:DNA-binding NarL/FixJ family response regulator
VNGDRTRVFVVAPTPFSRVGLRSILESAGVGADALVVGEADSVGGLVSVGADVVLVAGDDLLEDAARAVAEEGTQAILLLSEDDRSVSLLREVAPRGWGVVSPDAPPEELSAAIVAVAQGLVVLPRALTGLLLGHEAIEEHMEPLTAREREVLGLLGRGLSNKMIARDLRISEHTVKFHVSSIYAKLGAASRTEAVGLGARLGLISL